MTCATLKRRSDWDNLSTSPPEDLVEAQAPNINKRPRFLSGSPNIKLTQQFSPIAASTPVFPNTLPLARNCRERDLSISQRGSSGKEWNGLRKRLNFDDLEDDEVSKPKKFASEESGINCLFNSLSMANSKGGSDVLEKNIKCTSTSRKTEDTVLFTESQMQAIVDKLLQNRDAELRESYQKIMDEKLNEQYESFVKFTQNRATNKFQSLPESSYWS